MLKDSIITRGLTTKTNSSLASFSFPPSSHLSLHIQLNEQSHGSHGLSNRDCCVFSSRRAGLLNPQSSRRRDGALLKSYLRFGGVDKEYQGGEKVAQNSGTIVIRIH